MGRQKKRGRSRYWEQVRELADEHGWSVTEARGQWSRFYKKGGKKRKSPRANPIDPLVILDADPVDGPICPYCRVGFLDHEETSVCSGCQTRLHAECRAELFRCPTLGCAGGSSRAAETAAQRDPITIRIEPGDLPRRWISEPRIIAAALVAALVIALAIVTAIALRSVG